ncbi:MAG: alpha-glucan family phosphorylase [Chloroflexota bacterium]
MDELTVAYFSMEFGIDAAIPTYTGGLGILAGDAIRAAADLGLPAVGVTLLHRKGYFHQHLDACGNQSESDACWTPETFLEKLPLRVRVSIAGRPVQVQAWRYLVRSEFGHTVPIYFLDTCLPENTPWDQSLTDHLYGGDARYRLGQETVLGFGGIAMLRALGYLKIQAYHMNEGHSALVPLALMEEQTWGRGLPAMEPIDREAVIRHCVFTTHTPLPVGHDEFPIDLVREVLGSERADFLNKYQCCYNGALNMTTLALNFSRYVNGVSMRHEEIARNIYTNHHINAITNGVHAVTWTSPAFRELYDRFIPQWRRDNLYLKYAIRIPTEEIWQAHTKAKLELLAEVERRTGTHLDPQVMTIGFARRAAAYKRHDLIFHDLERLKRMVQGGRKLQIIYAGKAHPRDESGKALIRRVFDAANALKNIVPVVYLEEYDVALAKYVCSGVDLWLNTPQKPQEASGTSGMKAALNGVPTFSILDGWWIEGHIEGVTGWAIGDGWQSQPNAEKEAASIYDKLEQVIVPMYYDKQAQFMSIMRSAIALNGSYFNTQRMVTQYLQNAYLPTGVTRT